MTHPSACSLRRRSWPGANRRHGSRGERPPPGIAGSRLAAERLEPRTPLAVTAGLIGTDLQISLGAAHDRAVLARSGGDYLVSGTGLESPVVVDMAAVQGRILVQDAAGAAGQSFGIAGRGTITNPLRVEAAVEETTVSAAIVTAVAGDVSIDSPRIALAGSISTTATSAAVSLAGAVTLRGRVTIDAGSGDVTFATTVDGPHRFVVNSAGTTVFGGAVGGTKPLASLATDAGGTTSLGASVTTSGGQGQSYGDDVVLAADVTIAARAGRVQFGGRIDSPATAARGLIVRTAATTTFGGAVGSARPLALLVTRGGGATVIAGGVVTTAAGGRQTYGAAVRLTRNTVLDAADGPIRFAGPVDGVAADRPGAVADLVATPGSGEVSLSWSPPAFLGGGVSLSTVTTDLTTYARAVGGRRPLESVSRERAVFAGLVRTTAISDYVIRYSVDGGGTWRTFADGRSNSPSVTVTGLRNDQDHVFRVSAVNAVGEGAAATVAVDRPGGISFSFNYGTGSQYWSSAARQALESAAAALAATVAVDAPVNLVFTVTAQNSPSSDMLASAGSDTVSSGPGFFATVVQNKLLTGVDANGARADGEITWNFAHDWAFGDAVGGGQYDFRSTALHELLHAFGFLSYVDAAGTNTGTTWTTFDRFIVTAAGTTVIDPHTYRWNTTYNANLTGGAGGLCFGGTHAVAVYGGPVPLYTPDPWESGSSVSHLDDATFTGADQKLMNAMADTGPGVRMVGPLELAILQDLGYTLTT